jgi:hypothetical protein
MESKAWFGIHVCLIHQTVPKIWKSREPNIGRAHIIDLISEVLGKKLEIITAGDRSRLEQFLYNFGIMYRFRTVEIIPCDSPAQVTC